MTSRRNWVTLTVTVLVMAGALGGCASASGGLPSPGSAGAAGTSGPAEGGAADAALDYWTRTRLQAAQPWRRSPTPPPAGMPLAPPSARTVLLAAPRIGALFEHDPTGNHFCTASVVSSPGGDLIITAAHCLNDGHGHVKSDIVFVPGYVNGKVPFGVWTPRAVFVDPRWAQGADPAYDVGFVALSAQGTETIQDVLGANQIAFGIRDRQLVRVTGYPSNADAPITCRNWTSQDDAGNLRFDCYGFYGGTSGSPWLADFNAATHTGKIVGVIGGYEEGGDTDSVSYSSYLSEGIQRLYVEAEGAG